MPEAPVSDFQRGRFAAAQRSGNTVVRRKGPGARSVQRLLQHFEDAKTDLTPRVLDDGGPDGEYERLSYIPGETGYPPYTSELMSDSALVSVAQSIRVLHDISSSFAVSKSDTWHAMDATESPVNDCIGHGDLAPWNIVFNGSHVVGVIDWDTARPMSRIWDLSYAAYHFLPLHPVEHLQDWGWDSPPDVRERMRLFIEAYGGPLRGEDLVSAAAVRLNGMAVHIEQEIARANPLFEVHRVEGHASGYRAAAAQLVHRRDLGEFEGIVCD